ncbi:MAG: TonB-dependent receptor [Lentisphaerae bacterium]|nr:TonB-dependent receptor [Lentisphaerota bacterium]
MFPKPACWPCRIVCLMLLATVAPVAVASGTNDSPKSAAHLKELTIEELMAVEVSTVTTASRREETTLEAPGTVIVIDRRQIERRGYMTLVDVLRDLPGIDLSPNFFSEIGTQVAIRGISGNNKVIVLVNGMRINPPGGEYYPLRTDLSVRHAEQIEVIYGPGSTLYGKDAVAAVINIITETPKQNMGEVSAAAGPDHTQQGWGTVGGLFGDDHQFSFLGHVYYFHSDLTDVDHHYPDWWAPYREIAAPKGSGTTPNRLDDGLNMLFRLEAPDTSLQIFQRVSRRSSSEGFSTILGYAPEARWEDMSTVIQGEHTMPITEKTLLESSLTYNRYEIDPDSRYVFPSDDKTWFYDDYKYGLGTGASIEETLRVDVSPTVKLLAGGIASSYTVTPKSTVPGGADTSRDISSQAGSFVYFTEKGNPATRQEIRRAVTLTYQTYEGYAESAWQFLEDWKVIGGLRSTYDTRYSDTPLSPRFSLIHNVNRHVTAKYTFTKAYVEPAAYFGNAPYDNGAILNTSNPDLEPEEAQSHEIGLNYVDDHFHCGISGYSTRQENRLLVADSIMPQTILIDPVYMEDGSTRILGHTVNSGDSEYRGVDLYSECQFGKWSPWFSYSYVEAAEDGSWNSAALAGLSAHQGRLGTTWAPFERLLLTPSFSIRSRPEAVKAGALDSELDTPWQLDFYAQYRLTAQADLFTMLYNVTDHEYALAGVTGDAVPQETFHGMAGVKVRF